MQFLKRTWFSIKVGFHSSGAKYKSGKWCNLLIKMIDDRGFTNRTVKQEFFSFCKKYQKDSLSIERIVNRIGYQRPELLVEIEQIFSRARAKS